MRIPGFVIAGPRALDDDQRPALATFGSRRTYLADVNATIVDLFGVGAARATLPLANPESRSLVQRFGWSGDSVSLMSAATAVWEDDTVRYGVMLGEQVLMGRPGGSWECFHIAGNPTEKNPLPADRCGVRMVERTKAFPPL